MKSDDKKKWTPKRIAAIVALVLLAALYLVTFIVSLLSPTGGGSLFGVCLMAIIGVPVLAWIYIWLYGQMTGKKTIADLNLMQGGETYQEDVSEQDEKE